MQRILTAMGTPELNNKLKKVDNLYIYVNDIQYKEAIIDILEKDKNFDFLIIYDKLPGEIKIQDLIKKVKKINKKIKFIFILENEDKNLEKILFNENIKKIFYNKKINFDEIILEIKKNKNNNLINKKIEKNNSKIFIFYNYRNDIKLIIKNIFLLIKNKKILILDFNNKNKINNKYIKKINKNINVFNFNLFFKNSENTRIDIDRIINKYDLIYINLNNKNNIYNLENYFFKNSEKIIFILEPNINEIKNIKKIINKLMLKKLINKNKINILINKYNKNSINYKIIKNIFSEFKLIGKINLKNNNKNKKIIQQII